jgi:hypothetical protein
MSCGHSQHNQGGMTKGYQFSELTVKSIGQGYVGQLAAPVNATQYLMQVLWAGYCCGSLMARHGL